MNTKTKSLSLTKLKVGDGEHEGKQERRVTFVASTANEDRDYEVVQIDTFRLPLKGGGHIRVSELPATGASNIDIPLLTNHDLWDVSKAIGSVRNAYFEDGKLIFEAGISSRDYAQDIFKLIEEGHLDNAFSIQYRDYNRGDGAVDTDGEIVEVSVVTRGSNKDAQVLEVKSLNKEKEMTKTEDGVENKNQDETAGAQVETTAEETNTNTETEQNENQNQTGTEEAQAAEDAPEANTNENGEEKQMKTDLPVHKQIAASQAKSTINPIPAVMGSGNVNDYLKSKQADHDFAKTIAENYGKSSQMVMKAWSDKVRAKGITGDDILPTSIEQIFFKAWEDHYEMLGTFRRTTKLAGAVYSSNTNDTALGHKKGEKKAEQNLTDIRRDYKFKVMYKKLSIDLQDLIDDETGELLRFRTEELADRIGDELVKAIVFGDGRNEPTGSNPDYRIFDGTRGPWSMVNDLNNAGTTGSFSAAVATKIANVDTDTTWQKIIKTREAVRGGAGRKIIVVPEGTLTELALATNESGEPLFPLGTDMQNLFGTYIFESPYMAGSGYDVIGYRENSYLLAMGEMMTRTMFDLNYNTDVMLQERAVAGTIFGHKTLAGYTSKA